MKKAATVIMALAMAFSMGACTVNSPSPPPENPPEKPPEEEIVMPDGEQEVYKFITLYNAAESKSVGTNEAVFSIEKDTQKGRYLKLELENDVDVLGTFTYSNTKTSKAMTERFYVPAGKAGEKTEFRQFLDAFRTVANPASKTGDDESKAAIGQARKASWLKSVSFASIGGKTGTVKLHSVEASDRTINATKQLYLQNEHYKIGTDFAYGGALTYLEKLPENGQTLELTSYESGGNKYAYIGINASQTEGKDPVNVDKSVNLIDTHDTGRLIQQSYYGSAEGYEGIKYDGKPWRYNPVQGGDVYNNISQIIDYRLFEDEIYIKARAMDWARDGYTTPSYMEGRYRLEGELVYVTNTFTDWSGKNNDVMRSQEMPATYFHYALTHFVAYRGQNPWTGGALKQVTDLPFWGNSHDLHPDTEFHDGTENWIAWTNDLLYGVGVYVPGVNIFLNGMYGDKLASAASSTNYTAPIVNRNFESYRRDEYTFLLAVGNVQDMREQFKAVHDSGKINNKF